MVRVNSLKGYTAKKFFEYFPEAKKKYFWDSGLWVKVTI